LGVAPPKRPTAAGVLAAGRNTNAELVAVAREHSASVDEAITGFDVAWRTVDGLKGRYATGGKSGEQGCALSPWPESSFAFTPVWDALSKQFEVTGDRPSRVSGGRRRATISSRLRKWASSS